MNAQAIITSSVAHMLHMAGSVFPSSPCSVINPATTTASGVMGHMRTHWAPICPIRESRIGLIPAFNATGIASTGTMASVGIAPGPTPERMAPMA